MEASIVSFREITGSQGGQSLYHVEVPSPRNIHSKDVPSIHPKLQALQLMDRETSDRREGGWAARQTYRPKTI